MSISSTPDRHERRPWHYPDPWSGVVWLPNGRAPRPPLGWSARALIHAIGRLVACMMIGATLIMSAVIILAAADRVPSDSAKPPEGLPL